MLIRCFLSQLSQEHQMSSSASCLGEAGGYGLPDLESVLLWDPGSTACPCLTGEHTSSFLVPWWVSTQTPRFSKLQTLPWVTEASAPRGTRVPQSTYGGQGTIWGGWFSPSIMWALEIKPSLDGRYFYLLSHQPLTIFSTLKWTQLALMDLK